MEEVRSVVGQEWLDQQNFGKLSSIDLRRKLEEVFLKGSPWWLGQANLNGLGAQLVIVCCHMDSTANNESHYDKTTDPAPGADDNGSGIAAHSGNCKIFVAISWKISKYRTILLF